MGAQGTYNHTGATEAQGEAPPQPTRPRAQETAAPADHLQNPVVIDRKTIEMLITTIQELREGTEKRQQKTEERTPQESSTETSEGGEPQIIEEVNAEDVQLKE